MSEPRRSVRDGGDLELWGGVECTVNRVGDVYFDQLERSGHATRMSDLAVFAGLGIRAIRYPVLWERVAPEGPALADWSWADERLQRLRELDVRVIAGLTHHGSGPRHTSLVDPSFATGLADYARSVAERYPWIEAYTPVNEPLTTARFSGLYGLWYPHGRDDATFARALVNQCRAVVLAMRAIREVNPHARLIQTEDLGRTYGTPAVASMVEFYNHRRWLSLDLLCGRVTPDHPLYDALLDWGIGEVELAWHAEHHCEPDLIGVNHYASSDRYLDDAVHLHEGRPRGETPDGVAFIDTEAVRGCLECAVDVGGVLRDAWDRYGRPVAITEAHLGATREEQLRWLKEFWDSASTLRAEGVDVRAVTVWSLLGSFDWNALVTAAGTFYEPGPLDVRSRVPRRTALAYLMRDLSAGRTRQDDPLLALPGWWRRPDRVDRPAMQGRSASPPPAGPGVDMEDRALRPLVILGATGTLGQAFARACDVRGIPYHFLARSDVDLEDAESIDRALSRHRPWAVINAAGYVRVDEAEHDVEACMLTNAVAPGVLAAACSRGDVRLVCVSSDLVFDGAHESLHLPYVESDPVSPLNVYGRSKADMEARVLHVLPEALVVRTAAFFGPWDAHNFLTRTLASLGAGQPVRAALDETVSPTYVVDLVNVTLDLLIDREKGIWHLANGGSVTWAALAQRAAHLAGLPGSLIEPVPSHAFGHAARRPRYSTLGSERGLLMPPLDDALARYLHDVRARHSAADDRSRSRQMLQPPATLVYS
ncbi:sugar nucleotide-binding protein [Luteitalea sp.]|uniref:sugar nucleotide-binding protein n=1 Tax=Luteitalea sp. TaxID=2004800 RepID=UPI0025BD0ED3|nr:sugar nucleotide-binding protein [Luteitalea sp.]